MVLRRWTILLGFVLVVLLVLGAGLFLPRFSVENKSAVSKFNISNLRGGVFLVKMGYWNRIHSIRVVYTDEVQGGHQLFNGEKMVSSLGLSKTNKQIVISINYTADKFSEISSIPDWFDKDVYASVCMAIEGGRTEDYTRCYQKAINYIDWAKRLHLSQAVTLGGKTFSSWWGRLIPQAYATCNGTIYCGVNVWTCTCSKGGASCTGSNSQCYDFGSRSWGTCGCRNVCNTDMKVGNLDCHSYDDESAAMCNARGVWDCATGCSNNADNTCSYSAPVCTPGSTSCGPCSALCDGGKKTCTDGCSTWTDDCNTQKCCVKDCTAATDAQHCAGEDYLCPNKCGNSTGTKDCTISCESSSISSRFLTPSNPITYTVTTSGGAPNIVSSHFAFWNQENLNPYNPPLPINVAYSRVVYPTQGDLTHNLVIDANNPNPNTNTMSVIFQYNTLHVRDWNTPGNGGPAPFWVSGSFLNKVQTINYPSNSYGKSAANNGKCWQQFQFCNDCPVCRANDIYCGDPTNPANLQCPANIVTPSSPNLNSQGDIGCITNPNFTLSWSGTAGDTFDLQTKVDNGAWTDRLTNSASTTYNNLSVAPGHTYYWQVRSHNLCAASPWISGSFMDKPCTADVTVNAYSTTSLSCGSGNNQAPGLTPTFTLQKPVGTGTTYNGIHSGSASWTFNDVPGSGPAYRLEASNLGNWNFLSCGSTTTGVVSTETNPRDFTLAAAPSDVTATFYFVQSEGPWYQFLGGDGGAAGGTITANIPAGQSWMLPAGSNSPGALIASQADGVLWTGDGGLGNNAWQVEGSDYANPPDDYSLMFRLFEMEGHTNNSFSSSTIANYGTITAAAAAQTYLDGSMAYFHGPAGSTLNVTGIAIPDGDTSKRTVFVDGTLMVNGNIIVPTGAFLGFVVNGDIVFDGAVSQADGVYIAHGTIRVNDGGGSDTTPAGLKQSPRQFVGQGIFVGWANVDLNRDLQPTAPLENNKYAAERFIYRPDFIINAPDGFKRSGIEWQEVTPGN